VLLKETLAVPEGDDQSGQCCDVYHGELRLLRMILLVMAIITMILIDDGTVVVKEYDNCSCAGVLQASLMTSEILSRKKVPR